MQPQQGGFGGGGANQGPPDEFIIILIVVMVIALAIGLAIQIMYLLTLSKALSRCRPSNRLMEPGHVWFNLIPCFGTIWIFITVIRLADSLRNEFEDRRLPGDGEYGRSLGLAYVILFLLGAIPYIGGLFSLAGLVCWIMYWVKIAGYSRQLLEDSEDNYHRDDRDDDRGYRDDDDR